jgi:hypothetical protein
MGKMNLCIQLTITEGRLRHAIHPICANEILMHHVWGKTWRVMHQDTVTRSKTPAELDAKGLLRHLDGFGSCLHTKRIKQGSA